MLNCEHPGHDVKLSGSFFGRGVPNVRIIPFTIDIKRDIKNSLEFSQGSLTLLYANQYSCVILTLIWRGQIIVCDPYYIEICQWAMLQYRYEYNR